MQRATATCCWMALLALLPAGCLGPAHPPSASPTSTEPPPLVPANADYGGIEGYVFGPDLAPLPNATVSVQGTNLTYLSDEHGYYVILPVEPGNYRLEANATKHVPIVRSIAVGAGQGLRVDFTLTEIPNPQPYVDDSFQRRGQIQCTFRANVKPASTNSNPSCSDIAKDQTGGTLPPTQGANFTVGPGTMGVLIEVQWTPSTPGLNDKLRLAVRISEASTWNQFEGASPLRLSLGPAELGSLSEFAEKNYTLAGGRFVLNLYPGESVSTDAAAAGATFQQDYTMYATVFYREPPVPGYSRLAPK